MSDDRDRQIRRVLESVADPCSVAAGASMSLLDMGLVRGWEVTPDGDLDVRLDVTSPMCLMAGHFVSEVQTRLAQIRGLRQVTVRIDPSGDWTPDRMSPHGHELLSQRRETVR